MEEFLNKQTIEDKREKDMWIEFSEHKRKLLNMTSRDELEMKISEKWEETKKYIVKTIDKMKHQLYQHKKILYEKDVII